MFLRLYDRGVPGWCRYRIRFGEGGGEGVAESVRSNVFIYADAAGCFPDGFLRDRFVNMMAADDACAFVFGYFWRREKVLPDPVFIRIFVLAFQGVRQIYRAEAISKVFFVKGLYVSKVELQWLNE